MFFSLFEAISTHILIGECSDGGQRICFECEKLLWIIYRTKWHTKLGKRHSFPNATRNGTPQHHQHMIAPIDDNATLAFEKAFDDVASGFFGRNEHRVVAFGDEISAHKTWLNVGDRDVVVRLMGELSECLKILTLHSFGSTISWSNT